MTIDAAEGSIVLVIAAGLAHYTEATGGKLDAAASMQQAELVVRALELAGYQIRKKRH
jgi:hypothetical protein